MPQANLSFEAFAEARGYPSEGYVFRQALINYGVPLENIFAEEMAIATDENAEFVCLLLSRFAQRTFHREALKIGVLTNLFHVPRAIAFFNRFLPDGFTLQPIYAEDWIALQDKSWADYMKLFYRYPRGGVQYDVTKIGDIMNERNNFNFSRSVAELITE